MASSCAAASGGLRELGFEVQLATTESHLCCGSAGTYSVLQPELSHQLRDRKLGHLAPLKADAIVSANVVVPTAHSKCPENLNHDL